MKQNQFKYGQKIYLKSNQIGKPKIAYVVCETEGEHLIKLSETFPYISGKDKYFFVHASRIKKHWRHEKEGVQIKLF